MDRISIRPDEDGGCWIEFDRKEYYTSSQEEAVKAVANVETLLRNGAEIHIHRYDSLDCAGIDSAIFVNGHFATGNIAGMSDFLHDNESGNYNKIRQRIINLHVNRQRSKLGKRRKQNK